MLVDLGTRQVPFEIKLHSAPTAQDAQGLKRCLRDLRLRRGYLLYPGSERYSLGDGISALPVGRLLARPRDVGQL